MDNIKNKNRSVKREKRKTIAGIKLPPIEAISDGNVRTILNVDPAYYSLVEARPIRSNKSIHKYKQNIKDVAMKRTLHGFLVDEILRIDREVESERNIYETASAHFDEYQNSFDKFLADDNNKTIAIMKKSDALAKELVNQTEEHKKANYDMASLKSKLQYTDESLLILLSFQNFLNKASPILWQEKYKIKLDTKRTEMFCMDSDIFRKIDMDVIKERLKELPSPLLYFETPDLLIKIFYLLEKQNLNYLLVTEELNSQKNKFLKALEILKKLLRQELSFIQEKVNKTEDMITWNEIRETEVQEAFFKIFEEKIRYLVSSETSLQLFNYVEFAFEQLIAPNDTKLSSLDMTMALEREYDNLMLDISAFDLDDIKLIEKETYEKGDREIKQAREAGTMLKTVDKMSKRLKSSYEPSRKLTFE